MRLTSQNCTIYATAKAGTVVDGTAISATFKPDTSPSTNWNIMGACKMLNITNSTEVQTSISGVSGIACPTNQIITKKQIDVSIEFDTLNDDFLSLVFNSAKDLSGTTYTPYYGRGIWEGWIKVQAYNSEQEVLLWSADLYVSLKPEATNLTVGEFNNYTMTGTVLYSTLNKLDIPSPI